VQTNEIFYGETASLILSSTSSVVLYDIQQQKSIAEVNSPPVKYVVWSGDGSSVALMSNTISYLHPRLASELVADWLGYVAITIANKNFSQHSLIQETIHIKSGAWDDAGVFIYSMLNHIKYCLLRG